ncbi:CcmD family protein [Halodesulfovibrio sp.]|jgi:CcmD family protein|nr:CcmD family protein [Halodesulfovibrio sp.]MCT4534165.1 CcmD family protein [Halodesulfovibrio sp.]MCT4625929.1 CcmD family protein [Halodesulfovibrio sp.]
MESSNWLLMANVAVWVGIAGYLFVIARKHCELSKRIRQMELMND